MELYDPNGNAEDLDDLDTGVWLFDDLDPVIVTEQNPSQPLKSAGSQPRKKIMTILDPWGLAHYFISAHASSLREIILTCSAPTLVFWETLARDCSMTLESLTLVTDRIEQRVETAFWMACRNLISLDLECEFRSWFGDETMRAMHERSHFMTVREMDLEHCPNVTSKMINTVLVSCPALEFLLAERFYVVDMAQDGSQPWACLNMRDLRLDIDLFDPYQEYIESADNDVLEGEGGESDKEANEAKEARKSMEALQVAERQKLIMAQLAKLKKLRILYASQGYLDFYHGRPKECVEFILEKGLDQLAGLTQLEEIYFDCRSYTPCLPEAEWMLKHWKRLKIVHRGVYMVYLDKAGHDLRTMFTAPEGFEIDQEAFDVLFDVFL
ncbi:hypothetical protein BGZ80_011665 [Entomortierella chlamydospora]|uniref:F-box domain protein n=1 Tax=Entomortierella chlamydospora TaxID=101097 RepID=A0A9P6MT67_9FUNG|nr:hypothetical protein BGZ80_011665 [Entomortierella chlamydospora]